MRRPEQSHASLERELAALYQQYDLLDPDTPEPVKKRARLIKNRLSAKRSREQAREYVQKLETMISALNAESERLAQRLRDVEAENSRLKGDGSAASGEETPCAVQPTYSARTKPQGFTAAMPSEEKERTTTEPAALGPPSLQLDALLLVLTAVAASGTTQQQPSGMSTTTTKLLRLRQIMSRFAKAVLASRPEGIPRIKAKSRWKAARTRLLPPRRLPPPRPTSQPQPAPTEQCQATTAATMMVEAPHQ